MTYMSYDLKFINLYTCWKVYLLRSFEFRPSLLADAAMIWSTVSTITLSGPNT